MSHTKYKKLNEACLSELLKEKVAVLTSVDPYKTPGSSTLKVLNFVGSKFQDFFPSIIRRF